MPSLLQDLLRLPSALLALSISHALAYTIDARDTVPAPISILPDGDWDGIDGNWSSFNIKIGTPAQDVKTFISWSVYQTWAVVELGCSTATSVTACAKTRGGLYDESASSTFDKRGTYDLYVGQELGLYGNAIYGMDTVTLDGPNGNGPTVKNSLVGGFAKESFWMGIFGVNPKPTNFSSFNNESPSYMTLLKEQKQIPSVSFGYTAGAQYRDGGSVASLTLGGYDESKFVKNDRTWTFASDNSRDVVVALQSINTPSTDPSNPIATELLPSPIYAYLDALVAEIWLPTYSCEVFETEFGLQYDNTSELYLVNQTQHQKLLNRNASITFQLGITTDSEETVSIELPYAAFDLTAKTPYQYIYSDSYYFPLRRAANETQYWIGRTFFQEAYISIDYERSQFNVSQRNWDSSAPTHLVPIPEYDGSAAVVGSGSESSSKGLSSGAIAGIVVGAVAVLVLVAILLVFLFRRRSLASKRHKGEKLDSDAGSTNNNTSPSGRGQETTVIPKAELEGSAPPVLPPIASGALSSSESSSGAGSPNVRSGARFLPPRVGSSEYSPVTESPEPGTGTHSSTDSSSGTRNTTDGSGSGSGTGTNSGTLISPLSPISPVGASEADSQERQLAEMPGDYPTPKEKDGKELSEKEALAHREKIYNGVESPVEPSSTVPNFSRSSLQMQRRVNPEDVTTTNQVLGLASERPDHGRHRAFSFEADRPATSES